MNVEPTAPTPTDQATSDPAPLDPSSHVTAAPVTVSEIAEFLARLTKLRNHGHGDDPAARAAFLHRKAELFTRLTADPARSTVPPAPTRRTP
jgi:hypothetical protein